MGGNAAGKKLIIVSAVRLCNDVCSLPKNNRFVGWIKKRDLFEVPFMMTTYPVATSVFSAQVREKDDVADIRGVGNEHHQAINADAAAAGRG